VSGGRRALRSHLPSAGTGARSRAVLVLQLRRVVVVLEFFERHSSRPPNIPVVQFDLTIQHLVGRTDEVAYNPNQASSIKRTG
jgi:hypothetical protein